MKHRSMLIQLILSFFLTILLLLGLVGISYYRTTADAIGQLTVQTTRNSLRQGSQFVSAYIKKLEQTTQSLAHNPLILDYLNRPSAESEAQVLFLMNSILASDHDLVSAALVSKQGEIVSTDNNIEMKTSEDMMQEAWYLDAVHQKEMLPVLVPAHLKKLGAEKEDWIISVAQEISGEDGHNLAVLRLDISYHSLAQYLDQLDLGPGGFTFILNENHEFVYHPEKKVYSSEAEMNKMKPYIQVQDGYTAQKQQYVYQYPIPDCPWTLIGVASLKQLYELKRHILLSFTLFGAVSLLVCVGVVWFILRLWIRPLKELQKVMLAVGEGKHGLRARERGSAEVRTLSVQFNAMLDHIDRLMMEIRENEQNIRQYELRALSGQINPHFLYNTLDTIVWMAEFNDSKKVVELTKSLARYFRIALNKGNELITLRDEIDHVRQYLFIQKERYGERLNYEIEENNAFSSYMLPKLTLQPLVENAIYHGIKEVKRVGMISIRVIAENGAPIIIIHDNGAGFDPTDRKKISKKPFRAGGVGLDNVDQRLRLHFGEGYRMSINSVINEFTEIRLYLPIPSTTKPTTSSPNTTFSTAVI